MKVVVARAKGPLINSADLLVVPVITADKVTGKGALVAFSKESQTTLRQLDDAAGGIIIDALTHYEFKPSSGKRFDIHLAGSHKIVRLAGIDKNALTSEESLDEWRRLAGDARSAGACHKAKKIAVLLPHTTLAATIVGALAEGALLSQYEYTAYKKSKGRNSSDVKEFLIFGEDLSLRGLQPVIKDAEFRSLAVSLARDLVNCPPNDLQPTDLVRAARAVVSAARSRLSLQVLDKRKLAKLGAGAILAVGLGAETGPYILHLVLRSRGKSRQRKKVLLVGKGVTFDSGGLSIKPAKSMEEMKCDMAGAACVLSVMSALAKIGCQHEVHAVIPIAENSVNSNSVRPGDIVSALNKKSVEILNTDAEGRLILADALAYGARFKPDIVIDLATLTGACVVALGSDYAGLFTRDDALRDSILQEGKAAGELFWPLPLAKEYRPQLDSQIADLKNIGNGGPGATLGALFLEEFVPENVKWAHLDIAGPAFWSKSNEYTKAGGTGFGVRTLLRILSGSLS